MCGVVGYIGERPILPVLLEGLRRLEYRGYDSAGVVYFKQSKIEITKVKGRVYDLEERLYGKELSGIRAPGLAHTRWATHGEPSDENAHPHFDCTRTLALVHNGIIENYYQLKERLLRKGHSFVSATDTEVIVHLIEDYLQEGFCLKEAFLKTLRDLEGSFAIALISSREPDKILVARYQSPLVLGVGREESFLASDIPALLPFTKEVLFLKDKEAGILTQNGIELFDFEGNSISSQSTIIDWDVSQAEKGGYSHFMLKEIFEQPQALQNTLMGRISRETLEIDFSKEANLEWLKEIKKIYIVACGTSYHAGLVGKFYLERYIQIPVEVEIGSEFRYRQPFIGKNSLFIGISQSGETADTLASLRLAKERGAKILSICNVIGSSMTRESEVVLYNYAGPEISVASTKAFTTQVLLLLLFSLYAHKLFYKEHLSKDLILEFFQLPFKLKKFLDRVYPRIKELAKKWYTAKNFLYLGRNILYPLALEGALKLKELSYIHAEGYPAGEMKHGPIALIDETFPTFILSAKETGLVNEKTFSNAQEIKSRRGPLIGLFTEGSEEFKKICDDYIEIPPTYYELLPIFFVIPLQLFAYEMAVLKGYDVDKPRNLAKSVTVE